MCSPLHTKESLITSVHTLTLQYLGVLHQSLLMGLLSPMHGAIVILDSHLPVLKKHLVLHHAPLLLVHSAGM